MLQTLSLVDQTLIRPIAPITLQSHLTCMLTKGNRNLAHNVILFIDFSQGMLLLLLYFGNMWPLWCDNILAILDKIAQQQKHSPVGYTAQLCELTLS